jgi:hypothetical protein
MNINKEDFFFLGETTKKIEDLTDKDKGKWRELTDKELEEQMIGLIDYCYDSEYSNIDLDSFNFQVYDKKFYSEKYAGFPDEVYEILAESSKTPKVIDTREPNLQIKHEEVVVKFD